MFQIRFKLYNECTISYSAAGCANIKLIVKHVTVKSHANNGKLLTEYRLKSRTLSCRSVAACNAVTDFPNISQTLYLSQDVKTVKLQQDACSENR